MKLTLPLFIVALAGCASQPPSASPVAPVPAMSAATRVPTAACIQQAGSRLPPGPAGCQNVPGFVLDQQELSLTPHSRLDETLRRLPR